MTANQTGRESDDALSDFIKIQQYLFEQLGLHFRFAICHLESLQLDCKTFWISSSSLFSDAKHRQATHTE